jgi:hypothetical protein
MKESPTSDVLPCWLKTNAWHPSGDVALGRNPKFRAWPADKRHGYEAFIPFGALKRPAHSPSSLTDTASDILRRWR